MKRFVKGLNYATLLTLGTQTIRLPGVGLSLFQMMLIVSALVSVVFVFNSKIKKGSYLGIAIVWAISSVLAWQTSINPEWAKSYLLLGLMTAYLFFIIPICFDGNDIDTVQRMLIRSQYIVIPFSIYGALIFYTMGNMPEEILLPGGLSITLDDDTLSRGTAAGQIRLMLPYATPPVLSIVMVMCFTILLFSKNLFNKGVKNILLIVFFVIMIMTGSRSGIMGFVLFVLVLLFSGEIKRYTRKLNLANIIGVFFLLLCIFLIVLNIDVVYEYVEKMVFKRFHNVDSEPLSADRHFLVPLDGFLIWIDSLKNFFFGIGFGSSLMMQGAHTYLPPYFLNSFITLVAERGILGLILVVYFIRLAVSLFKKRKLMTDNEKALVYSLIVGLFSSLFYENLICYFVIYDIAMALMLETSLINKQTEVGK